VTTVLVIDDEAPLRRALRTMLDGRQFDVVEAAGGQAGVVAAAGQSPDVVVLDLGLPDLDGMEVLERIRSFSDVPVVVLTARDRPRDAVAALEAGADDYITKPFDTDELVARMRAALRRRPTIHESPPVITVDDLVIDLAQRMVTRGGQRVALTKTEMRLLEALATSPGILLTHDVLLRRVWGPGYGTESNYLRTFVGQLRKKLGDDAASPRLILTESGIGYRWIGLDEPES
jgi:two-component system KDP operon response regulator KdpE